LCLAYQRLKRDADADRALKEFRTAGGEPSDMAVLQSRLASLRGDDENAKAILEHAQVEDKSKLRREKLRLFLATKDLTAARVLLVEDYKLHPHNLFVLRQLAELDLERGANDQVISWEKELQKEGVTGE